MAKATQKKNEEITSEVTEEKKTESATNATEDKEKPRVINHPKDVAALALSQLNAINAKKDELTIAIKGLSDLTTQLVNVYAGNMNAMQQMQARIKELEEKSVDK